MAGMLPCVLLGASPGTCLGRTGSGVASLDAELAGCSFPKTLGGTTAGLAGVSTSHYAVEYSLIKGKLAGCLHSKMLNDAMSG